VQTCLLSAFALTPSFELFKSLESCCQDVVEWPGLRPEFPGDVDGEKYTQLLDAVNLLRDVPKYRPTPAGWQTLKPILVERFEEVGVRFRTAENKYIRAMARKSVTEARSLSSATKGHRNTSTVSKLSKSPDAVQDLHMSVVSGDENGTVDSRDEVRHTQTHTESTVDNTGPTADADSVDVNVTMDESAAVEDDAASDVTIPASDADNSEYCKQSIDEAAQEVKMDIAERSLSPSVSPLTVNDTEDKSSQLPLNDCSPSNTVFSTKAEENSLETGNVVTGVNIDQNSLETENVVHDAYESVSSSNVVNWADVIQLGLQPMNEVVGEECVKMNVAERAPSPSVNHLSANEAEEKSSLSDQLPLNDHSPSDTVVSTSEAVTDTKAEQNGLEMAKDVGEECVKYEINTEQISEILDSVESQLDVNKASDTEAETAKVIDKHSMQSDAEPASEDYLESETVTNKCENSLSLPSLTQNIDTADYGETQYFRNNVNAAEISTSFNLTSSLSSKEEALTSSDSVADACCSDSVSPVAAESASVQLLSNCMEYSLCIDNGIKSVIGDVREKDADEMLITDDVNEKTSHECLEGVADSESGECVSSVSISQTETTITDDVQDPTSPVADKADSITGSRSDTSRSCTFKLSGNTADITLSRCSVSLYRIPVSAASRNAADVSSTSACSKLQRRCSVVLQRLGPSLQPSSQAPSKSSAPVDVCTDEDDNVSITIILSSDDDDDDDDDDMRAESAKDDVLEPLSTDNQCCGAPEQTSVCSYTLSQEYSHESVQERSVIDTEENHGNITETQLDEGSGITAEATLDTAFSNVNTSAILDAEEDGDIAAGEDEMCRYVAVAERQHGETSEYDESHMMSDESHHDEDGEHSSLLSVTVDSSTTGCSVGHEDNKQEMLAVDENSDKLSENNWSTDMLTHPVQLDYLSYLASEIISDRNTSSEPETEDVIDLLDRHDTVDLSAAVQSEDEDVIIVAEDAASCDVTENVAVETTESILSCLPSTNMNSPPRLLLEEDVEVTATNNARNFSTVEVTNCSLSALSSENTDLSAIVDLKNPDDDVQVTGIEYSRIPCYEAAEDGVIASSLSALTSTNVELSADLSSDKSSVVTADENAICSDVIDSAAIGAAQSQLWAEDEKDDGIVTASVSEETTTSYSDVTETATFDEPSDGELSSLLTVTVDSSAIFGHEVQGGNISSEDLRTSYSDVTDMVTDKATVAADESVPTSDAVNVVTEHQIKPTGSVDTVVSQCAAGIATHVHTTRTDEQSDSDTQRTPDETDDGVDVVVCDPFPIFSACTARSGSVDNLRQSRKLQDNTKEFEGRQSPDKYAGVCEEDAYSLVLQPDVPEPSDEIYLCTTATPTQSSSEGQSEVDCEDDLDTDFKNCVSGQSATNITAVTASDVDINIGGDVVSDSINHPLSSDSVTAAESSICLKSEQLQIVDIHCDDMNDFDTAYLAVADTEADTVNIELSYIPDYNSQDTESCEVQNETEEYEEELEHCQVDSAQLEQREVDSVQIEHREVDSVQLEHHEIDSAQLEQREVDSLQLEHCQVDSAQFEYREVDSVQLEHHEIDSAQLEQHEVDSIQLEQREVDSLQLDHCQVDSAQFEYREVDTVQIEHHEVDSVQLEHREVDSIQPIVYKDDFAVVKHDVAACSEEFMLPEQHEITQETLQEVTGESRTVSSVSAMLHKLGAICKNVSQKVQSTESTTREDLRPISVEPVREDSIEQLKLVSTSPSSASHSYCCPYCALKFVRYTNFFTHLRAENAGQNKSAHVGSEGDRHAQESVEQIDVHEPVQIHAPLSATGKKARRCALSTAGKIEGSNSSEASQQTQLDTMGFPPPVPAKSRRSLPKSSAALSGRSQKRSLPNSGSTAGPQSTSDTSEFSIPIPSKSRRSLPKSFHKDNTSASTGRSQKRKSFVSHDSDSTAGSVDHKTRKQQSQRSAVESSHPVVDKSRRSLPKASSSTGRSKKALVPAVESSDVSAAVQRGKRDTVKSTRRVPAKSRSSLSKSFSQDSTAGSQKSSATQSSVGNQPTNQDTEKSSQRVSYKSRCSLPKSFSQDSAAVSTSGSQKSSTIQSSDSSVGNQPTKQDTEKSSQRVSSKSRRSLPKSFSQDTAAGSTSGSQKSSATQSCDSNVGNQLTKQDTENSSHSVSSKSRRSLPKSFSQDNAAISTSGSQKSSATQSSDSNVGNQQTKQDTEKSTHSVSSKSRRSLPKSVCQGNSTSKARSRSRRSEPCMEPDSRAAETPAAVKRLSSASCARDAKKNKR